MSVPCADDPGLVVILVAVVWAVSAIARAAVKDLSGGRPPSVLNRFKGEKDG